jgi:hypothetical protein
MLFVCTGDDVRVSSSWLFVLPAISASSKSRAPAPQPPLGPLKSRLEHRTLRLNRRDSAAAYVVIRYRREVIRDAETLFT